MKDIEFNQYHCFNHYIYNGLYAVRMYDRKGNGMSVAYMSSFVQATQLRKMHALNIGLEPEPAYNDFAYYPTIWKWNKENYQYERILGF